MLRGLMFTLVFLGICILAIKLGIVESETVDKISDWISLNDWILALLLLMAYYSFDSRIDKINNRLDELSKASETEKGD